MADSSNEEKVAASESDANTDRRGFIRGAAAVGLLGALGSASALGQPAPQQGAVEDPQAPKGLAPLGMLDYRFPMSYETSVPAGVRVLTQYFAALSRRDLKGMAETLHFPFASYEGTDPVVVQTADELLAHAPASMNMTENPERYTDHDGYLKPGSYDAFDSLEVITADPVSAAMSLVYYRYEKGGKKLLRCQGLYTVTNNDGKWAIQLMSTIFTPADMMYVTFEDTITIAKRLRMTHDLAFQVSDHMLENGPFQTGKIAAIAGGAGSVFYQKAPNMDPYRVKGVKSRLQVSEQTPETTEKYFGFDPSKPGIPSDYAFYRALFPRLGVGNWGFVYGVLPETRVLHATVDKAHMLSGAIRFNTDGEECNYNRNLSVVTYKKGHWGIAGSFAYVAPHDRANDMV
jgi:hypothetical protein